MSKYNPAFNTIDLFEDKNFWLEFKKYARQDAIALYKSMLYAKHIYLMKYYIDLSDVVSTSSLSLKIFRSKFLDTNIPILNSVDDFFIRKSYIGGATDYYKLYGENLYYYDVNSLYPYAALNPIPGTDCYYIETFKDKGLDLDKLFGFFYAKVKTNNQYLGLLPVHRGGRLICPNGEFEGIWSSEELKFAKSKGYEITVIKGYQFNKVNNIFKDYILELFNFKNTSTGFLKLIYKSLLNNFLGRFGLNLIKPLTQTVNKEKRDFILSTRIVHSQTILN